MKKYLLMLLLLFVLSLSSCSKTVVDVPNDIIKEDPVLKEDPKDEIEDKKEDEGDVVVENRCKVTDNLTLNKTDTLTALELWDNSSVCDNLVYNDGVIQLDDYLQNGTLETGSFSIDSFEELVPSWNVLIDEHSTVSILVALGNSEGFGKYYVMSLWQSNNKLSFKNQEDEYARVSIDTIIPIKNDIDRIKFKVVLAKSENDNTKLKNLSITTTPLNSVNDYSTSALTEHEITVSPRQQLSIPNIGNSICSPTSLSMLLNYYGYTDAQELVAANVYDNGSNIYGNWSFNASYAGGFDLYSRVEYVNELSVLMEYINNDIPLALSIKTSSKEALEGSIMAYPAGHLVVLSGFVLKEGNWYAVINDPAEYDDNLVRREYKLEQILEAWRGYVYVVQETEFE